MIPRTANSSIWIRPGRDREARPATDQLVNKGAHRFFIHTRSNDRISGLCEQFYMWRSRLRCCRIVRNGTLRENWRHQNSANHKHQQESFWYEGTSDKFPHAYRSSPQSFCRFFKFDARLPSTKRNAQKPFARYASKHFFAVSNSEN